MKWREYVIICGTQSLHNHSHEPNSLMSPNSNESGCYYTLLLQRTSYIVPRDQTIQQAGFCHWSSKECWFRSVICTNRRFCCLNLVTNSHHNSQEWQKSRKSTNGLILFTGQLTFPFDLATSQIELMLKNPDHSAYPFDWRILGTHRKALAHATYKHFVHLVTIRNSWCWAVVSHL